MRAREWRGRGKTHSSLVGEKEFEALDVLQLDMRVEQLEGDLEEG